MPIESPRSVVEVKLRGAFFDAKRQLEQIEAEGDYRPDRLKAARHVNFVRRQLEDAQSSIERDILLGFGVSDLQKSTCGQLRSILGFVRDRRERIMKIREFAGEADAEIAALIRLDESITRRMIDHCGTITPPKLPPKSISFDRHIKFTRELPPPPTRRVLPNTPAFPGPKVIR